MTENGYKNGQLCQITRQLPKVHGFCVLWLIRIGSHASVVFFVT